MLTEMLSRSRQWGSAQQAAKVEDRRLHTRSNRCHLQAPHCLEHCGELILLAFRCSPGGGGMHLDLCIEGPHHPLPAQPTYSQWALRSWKLLVAYDPLQGRC